MGANISNAKQVTKLCFAKLCKTILFYKFTFFFRLVPPRAHFYLCRYTTCANLECQCLFVSVKALLFSFGGRLEYKCKPCAQPLITTIWSAFSKKAPLLGGQSQSALYKANAKLSLASTITTLLWLMERFCQALHYYMYNI